MEMLCRWPDVAADIALDLDPSALVLVGHALQIK
jgi:hypothetical protein